MSSDIMLVDPAFRAPIYRVKSETTISTNSPQEPANSAQEVDSEPKRSTVPPPLLSSIHAAQGVSAPTTNPLTTAYPLTETYAMTAPESPLVSRDLQPVPTSPVEDENPAAQNATDLRSRWNDNDTVRRVSQVVTRSTAGDIFKGVINSRIFKAVVLSALGLLAVGGVALLLTTPPGWVFLAVAAALFIIGLLFPLETSAFTELFSDSNSRNAFREIALDVRLNSGRIYLGKSPTRNDQFGEFLANEKNVKTLISAKEPGPQHHFGIGPIPYRFKDWMDLGVKPTPLEADVHTLQKEIDDNLPDLTLDKCADFIGSHLQYGSVYVCEGDGVGRIAVAAYLLKQNRELAAVLEQVGETRPEAIRLLENYNRVLSERRLNREAVVFSGVSARTPSIPNADVRVFVQ